MVDTKRLGASIVVNTLSIIFSILLLVSLFRFLTGHGSQILSFSGFLEMIHNVPTINVEILNNFYITADWGAFNFFKEFLNFFAGLFSVVGFWFANLYNVLVFVIYLFTNLFFIF